MKTQLKKFGRVFAIFMLVFFMTPYIASAADGNWKKGRIYYRMVCTACHKNHDIGSISPSSKTIAEWNSYIKQDDHAKGKDKISFYVSKDYRHSIKSTNKAAAKYIDISKDELLGDVKAFVVHGAKDSDTPTRCN